MTWSCINTFLGKEKCINKLVFLGMQLSHWPWGRRDAHSDALHSRCATVQFHEWVREEESYFNGKHSELFHNKICTSALIPIPPWFILKAKQNHGSFVIMNSKNAFSNLSIYFFNCLTWRDHYSLT